MRPNLKKHSYYGPSITKAAEQVDQVFLLIFGVSAAILVLITVLMVWFVIRYLGGETNIETFQTYDYQKGGALDPGAILENEVSSRTLAKKPL